MEVVVGGDCYFVTCNICNKRGHLARDCWLGLRRDSPYPDPRGYRPSPRIPYSPYAPDRRGFDRRSYPSYPDRYLPDYRQRDPPISSLPPSQPGQQLAHYSALDQPRPLDLDRHPDHRRRDEDWNRYCDEDRRRDEEWNRRRNEERRDVQPYGFPDYGFPIEPSHPPDFDQFCHMASNDPTTTTPLPTGAHIGDWLIDSGATNHYTSRFQLLHNFRPLQDIPILTGKGYIFARGIGDISIHLSVGAATVRNVLWVPELAGVASLLSVPQLTRAGCTVIFKDHICQIFMHSTLLANASFRGKAYYLDVVPSHTLLPLAMITVDAPVTSSHPRLSQYPWVDSATSHTRFDSDTSHPRFSRSPWVDSAMLHGTSDIQTLDTWHKRLGHLNQDSIRRLQTMSTGVEIGDPRSQSVNQRCRACLQGAQHKHISRIPRLPVTKLLEIVHLDIKGPCDSDVRGFRYWVNFTCEKSRFNWGYPLISKSDVFGAYRAFEALAQRESGCFINTLMLDNAGEMSNEWRAYLVNRGIKLRQTAPYSPEMNGIAERLIRVLVEHASAMLWDAHLPMAFWAPAMTTPNFLRNRSPTSALPDQTPFQAWYGRPPNLGFVRVFGCRAQVHVPREIRSKTMWDSKSTDCILIGFSDTENIYELWDIAKGAVIKRRDVIFWEDELGSASLQRHALPNGTYIFPVHDIAQKYAEEHMHTHPVPSHRAKSPFVTLPPRPAQQSVPHLPSTPASTAEPAAVPQFTWLPPLTAPVPNSTYQDVQFVDEAAVLHAFIGASFDAQCLGFSMIHGRVPRSYHDAMSRPDASRWLQAMNLQLQKLRNAGTWTLVPLPPGKRAIHCKWVFNYKDGAKATAARSSVKAATGASSTSVDPSTNTVHDNNISSASTRVSPDSSTNTVHDNNISSDIMENARLVARGDLQSKGVDYLETFAPVVKLVSLRLLLTYAAIHDLDIVHWDVVAAFLTGDLTEEVFMFQPPGFDDGSGRVCRLNKSIYGLCQSARVFFQKLDNILTKNGWVRLHTEWALWKHSSLNALIGSHVDDFCVVGPPHLRAHLKTYLEQHDLIINDFGPIESYLGIQVQRDRSSRRICLSQQEYAEKIIKDTGMDSCNPVSTPMLPTFTKPILPVSPPLPDSDVKRYQRTIGSLLYLVQATRPDLAYPVIRLSQFASSPCRIHADALKRVLRYLRGTIAAKLLLGDLSPTDLLGYFDAAFGDSAKRFSTCGYVFLFFGSPISWASKVQRTVALSTVESEYMAATEAAKELVWIRSVAEAVTGHHLQLPVCLYGDNNGAIALSKNPEFHPRTKHIDIRYRFITELTTSGTTIIKYIPTHEMLADGFTRPLSQLRHWHDFQTMGLLFGKKWICPVCQRDFDDRRELHDHISVHRLEGTPQSGSHGVEA